MNWNVIYLEEIQSLQEQGSFSEIKETWNPGLLCKASEWFSRMTFKPGTDFIQLFFSKHSLFRLCFLFSNDEFILYITVLGFYILLTTKTIPSISNNLGLFILCPTTCLPFRGPIIGGGASDASAWAAQQFARSSKTTTLHNSSD
jgi:hypothetical protein